MLIWVMGGVAIGTTLSTGPDEHHIISKFIINYKQKSKKQLKKYTLKIFFNCRVKKYTERFKNCSIRYVLYHSPDSKDRQMCYLFCSLCPSVFQLFPDFRQYFSQPVSAPPQSLVSGLWVASSQSYTPSTISRTGLH